MGNEKNALNDISKAELKARGVSSLATRPNAPSRYGEGGLTAEQLKERFDALSGILADRINKIHAYLKASDLDENINVTFSFGEKALSALASDLESGEAAKYIKVYVNAEAPDTLQEVINGILGKVATNAENIDKAIAEIDLKIVPHDAANELVFTARDNTGKVVSTASAFIPNADYYIADHNSKTINDGVHPYLAGLIQANGMEIDALKGNVATISGKIEDVLSEDIGKMQKQIYNLLANIPAEYFVTDAADAYTKQIPATALPWAELQEVGGMSYSVGNLFDAEHVENQFGGAKENIVVENGGAKITITGDPDGSYNSVNLKFEAGVTYCATFGGNGKLYYVPAPAALTEIKSGVPFTPPTSTYYDINCLAFGPDGGTYTDLMIVMGDKPAEYMPYGQSTLKNAAVTALEIIGTNRLDLSGAINECFRDNGDGTYTITKVSSNDRFSAKFPLYVPNGQDIFCQIEIVDTNMGDLPNIPCQCFDASGAVVNTNFGLVPGGNTYKTKDDVYFARMYLHVEHNVGDFVTFRNSMIQFVESHTSAKKPYAPYRKYTINIPDEVQNLQGYGQGNPTGTEYNYIDYTRRVFVQKGYRDSSGAWIPTGREIDISAYLPEDNLIEVEGNGSITFVNAENLPVPSKIEYQLKEANE